MSTDKEFDSWENIKRIDREWKQCWYEFGYQTLQKQIDSLNEENVKIQDQKDIETSCIIESERRIDELDLTFYHNINKKRYLCYEMARKNNDEEKLLISNPQWISFSDEAEKIIEEKFNQSKRRCRTLTLGGFCGCGLNKFLIMQKGSHRKNDIHRFKVKSVALHLMRVDQVLQILVKVIPFGKEWLVECIIPFLFPQLEWNNWEVLVEE